MLLHALGKKVLPQNSLDLTENFLYQNTRALSPINENAEEELPPPPPPLNEECESLINNMKQ